MLPRRKGPGRPKDAPRALKTRIAKLLHGHPSRAYRAPEVAKLLDELDRVLVVRATLRQLHREGRVQRLSRGLFQATHA
jgi:hypothetical protein